MFRSDYFMPEVMRCSRDPSPRHLPAPSFRYGRDGSIGYLDPVLDLRRPSVSMDDGIPLRCSSMLEHPRPVTTTDPGVYVPRSDVGGDSFVVDEYKYRLGRRGFDGVVTHPLGYQTLVHQRFPRAQDMFGPSVPSFGDVMVEPVAAARQQAPFGTVVAYDRQGGVGERAIEARMIPFLGS